MKSASLAILLGASEFPQAREFPPSEQFKNTHDEFLRYFSDIKKIRQSELLDLFNSPDDASRQLRRIENFLENCDKSPSTQGKIRDLFIIYIGHGILKGGIYSVAVRELETDAYHRTALRMSDLGISLAKFKKFRKFVFLDSCFAARVIREWGAPGDEVVGVSADVAFGGKGTSEPGEKSNPDDQVTKGTTIFCAADQTNVAISPQGMKLTMFGDAVLSVLRTGSSDHREYMSLADIEELTVDYLRERYPQDYIRPVVHSPHQPEGDIRKVRIFKNLHPRPQANVNSEGNSNTGNRSQVPENGSLRDGFPPRINHSLALLLRVLAGLVMAVSLLLAINYVKKHVIDIKPLPPAPPIQSTVNTDSQPNSTLQAPPVPTPEAQPEPTSQPQPEPTPETQPKSTPQPESVPTPEAQPKSTPQPQPVPTTPKAQPKPAPQPQPVRPAEGQPKSTPEPAPKSPAGTWAQMNYDARCLLWRKCTNIKFLSGECKLAPSTWDRGKECLSGN